MTGQSGAGSTAKLYTPHILALSTRLALYPLTGDHGLRANARSRSCGSTIEIGFALDEQGRIASTGMTIAACAIGQASAAILANAATGRGAEEIIGTHQALSDWLDGDGDLPDWPGIEALEPVLPHTGRHGALLLSWKAASEALCNAYPAS